MSKAKYFWITRNSGKSEYEVWSKKPSWSEYCWFSNIDNNCEKQVKICPEIFEVTTGIHFKGGPRSITRRRLAV